MNTLKYYMGQKVITTNGKESIVMGVNWNTHEQKYLYAVDGYKQAVYEEDELTRPPAKLEFGYCAVGDTVEDCNNEWITIEAVQENMFAYSWFGNVNWTTYNQAKVEGWKIKEEVGVPELIEGVAETITLNGKTYKLVE